jgi:general secretion pathway protein G
MKLCRPSRVTGFTLVELVVTVAIMAILATAALPLVEVTVQRSKEQELHAALREIRGAIDAYKQAVDDKHVTKAADASGYPKSLDVLVEGVDDALSPKKSKLYFLRRIPRDPMARDASLPATQTWGLRSYQSSAEEPQEGDDVFDVYSLSDKVGLNGVPYREW